MDNPVNEPHTQPLKVEIPDNAGPDSFDERKFFPSGAIVFFILLVILSLVFWYGIYLLMIERN